MRAFIDGISDGMARVLFGEEERVAVSIPVELLPKDAREGDVLQVRMTIDRKASEEGKRHIEALLSELGDEP